jgi:hypothetical protein
LPTPQLPRTTPLANSPSLQYVQRLIYIDAEEMRRSDLQSRPTAASICQKVSEPA